MEVIGETRVETDMRVDDQGDTQCRVKDGLLHWKSAGDGVGELVNRDTHICVSGADCRTAHNGDQSCREDTLKCPVV